jgi:hypothetical protein
MWIMYVSMAGIGLLASFAITKQHLEKSHTETKTGLEEEELKRKERQDRRKTRRQSRLASKLSRNAIPTSPRSPSSPGNPVPTRSPAASPASHHGAFEEQKAEV